MKLFKKGQINITETVGVLFVFFIIILFGIIFYYNYQKIALKERQEELLGARAIDTTLKALFLPELICSNGDAEPKDNCMDLLKVRYITQTNFFKTDKKMQEYYFEIFSYSRIAIKKLYPQEEPEIVLYDREKIKMLDDGTVVPDWQRKEPTFFIITLRDETAGSVGAVQYSFGYLIVEVYA